MELAKKFWCLVRIYSLFDADICPSPNHDCVCSGRQMRCLQVHHLFKDGKYCNELLLQPIDVGLYRHGAKYAYALPSSSAISSSSSSTTTTPTTATAKPPITTTAGTSADLTTTTSGPGLNATSTEEPDIEEDLVLTEEERQEVKELRKYDKELIELTGTPQVFSELDFPRQTEAIVVDESAKHDICDCDERKICEKQRICAGPFIKEIECSSLILEYTTRAISTSCSTECPSLNKTVEEAVAKAIAELRILHEKDVEEAVIKALADRSSNSTVSCSEKESSRDDGLQVDKQQQENQLSSQTSQTSSASQQSSQSKAATLPSVGNETLTHNENGLSFVIDGRAENDTDANNSTQVEAEALQTEEEEEEEEEESYSERPVSKSPPDGGSVVSKTSGVSYVILGLALLVAILIPNHPLTLRLLRCGEDLLLRCRILATTSQREDDRRPGDIELQSLPRQHPEPGSLQTESQQQPQQHQPEQHQQPKQHHQQEQQQLQEEEEDLQTIVVRGGRGGIEAAAAEQGRLLSSRLEMPSFRVLELRVDIEDEGSSSHPRFRSHQDLRYGRETTAGDPSLMLSNETIPRA